MALNTPGWNRIRYTLYAPVYDRLVRLDRARREVIDALDLRPGERVLIVGAGTGQDLDFLPPGVEVTVGDIAPGMLRQLRERAGRLGRTVEVHVLDASRLPFADASFDVVLLHLVVAIVPDPRGCLAEAARVVRPGGRISVLDKFAPDEGRVPLWRRILNPVAETLATSVDRRLGPLLAGLPLRVESRRPVALRGILEAVVLRREASGSSAPAEPRRAEVDRRA
jgi:ubiquinone/menaquinone biosynthesis C-methylase UbiE